jgi:hypothetical protein
MAMPTYTPVGFVLLQERQLGLALLSLLGVLFIEPLPDNDQWILSSSQSGLGEWAARSVDGTRPSSQRTHRRAGA